MNFASLKNPKKKRRIDEESDSEPLPGPSSQVLPLVAPHLVRKSSKDPNRSMYPSPKGLSHHHRHSSSPRFVKAPALRRRLPQSVADRASHSADSSPQFVKASTLQSRLPQSVAEETSQSAISSPQFAIASTLEGRLHQFVAAGTSQSANLSLFLEESELIRTLPQRVIVDTSESANIIPQSELQKSQPQPVNSASTNCNEVLQEHSSLGTNSTGESMYTSELNSARRLFNSVVVKGKRRSKFTHTGAANRITKYFKLSGALKPQTVKPVVKPSETKSASESTKMYGWRQKDDSMVETLAEISNEQFFQNFRDCYGLVESVALEDVGEDYFSFLPTHIIENILCQIPMLDLMACRQVCSRWNEIIDGERYMRWKKLYHRLKRSSNAYRQGMKDILTSVGYTTLDSAIPSLIKYMECKFNHVPSSDMSALLMQDPKGNLADRVLSERFPELNGKETRVWCQFALAIIISETVWDIFELYKSMFTVKSGCSRADVTDAMYCVATFLLYFRLYEDTNSGMHYRLYYALYLIENRVPTFQREKLKIVKGLPGQQSMRNYSHIDCSFLTYEQIRVLNHQFDMNQKIRIIALAGTGKTTTLLYLSKLYPQIKFLNLVFNKSVNEEAKRKFPQNVTCKTAHSLAFASVGKFLRHKLTSTLRPYDLINHLKNNSSKIQIYSYANLVLSTINSFTLSSASEIGLTHVPSQDYNRHHLLTSVERENILKDATEIWQMMKDQNNPFKITHDVYLKLYHLKRPKLNKYQCIMVDEAQDCNPAILDIVLTQTMPVIFVGDPNQQIYAFRGAQNALECIGATHTYHLTKSFRFGPEISYIASCILEYMLNTKRTTIVGSTNDSYINGKVGGQYAVIARTNITLFNEALRMVVFKRLKTNEPSVINAAFAGGISSYGFDQIADIYRLKNASISDKPVTDKFISRFKAYSDFVSYARFSDDSDLLSKIEIVNQHGHDVTKFISILKERCRHSLEHANVVFTTAHKSKGLEFDTVCLADDFQVSTVPGLLGVDTSREESHILYVAVTRAKKYLVLPENITKVLYLAFEKFEYPVSSKSVLRDKPALMCVVCDTSFVPHTVLMYIRRKIVLASEREISEGPLCMKCGSDPQMRPDVHMNGLIMYLDAVHDNGHVFMSKILGPLPSDPPIVHNRWEDFENAERVFVINLNIH